MDLPTLEQRLNATPPPESIDAFDVYRLSLEAGGCWDVAVGWRRPGQFIYERPDGHRLIYIFGVDSDREVERYYLPAAHPHPGVRLAAR